jgi:YidC/Oxa1 family membrane protein insertase
MEFLREFMTSAINFFYNITEAIHLPSYGLAIILFTIVFKMVLLPLTLKQMKSAQAMKVLSPKIKEVQEKYKKDPQKAQQAMLELYKQYNVNPMAGCLPLLIQMPILYALFAALREFKYPTEEAAQFLWIPSLSEADPYYILAIVAAVATFVQMKMTMANQDQTQKVMLYSMPLIFGWMSATFPSGLGLYWVFFTIVGALQQYFINKQPLVEEIKEEPKKNEKHRKNS